MSRFDQGRSVSVRSYRDVVDVVERRIFRVDRWRIPHPSGVSAAALGYFVALLVAVLAASKLPVVGGLLGVFPPALRYLGLATLGAWALTSWQVDGRRPHHALVSCVRHGLSARTRSGLRRTLAVGAQFTPLDLVRIVPSGDEPRYRAGRVRGPATVALRYPARLSVEGSRPRRAADAADPVASARRVRVSAIQGPVRPLAEGRVIRVPEGSELSFE